jgi:N-acetylglucosamine malate deacetylase 1
MRVLAIVAHPDDETLGCGGTLLAHAERGDELHWLIATSGTEPQWDAATLAAKTAEIERVAEAYGFASVTRLGLPAARLDTVPQAELIADIGEVVAQVRPEVVYLVHSADTHTDHHALYHAAMSVLKPFHLKRLGVRRVLSFETLSSTEAAALGVGEPFKPTVVHDISGHLDRKVEIMALFVSEAQPDPLPRGPSAIRALARFRGATIGVEHGEAFVLLFEAA